MNRPKLLALAGAAAGVAAGVAAERMAVRRRRRSDPEADAPFGELRGERSRKLTLADGAQIFVEEMGPPRARSGIIFVHGSAMRTDLWHYQMTAFPGRRLVFYDMRGHGRSQPKGDNDYTVATLAQDLEAVMEACGLREAVVVGHSIGGMAALELGSSRPDLLGDVIKGLVLVNATYRPPMETIAGGAAIARLERVARRPLDLLGSQSRRIDSFRRVIKPSDTLFWGVSFAAFGPGASARQIDFTYDMLAETPSDVIFDLFKAYRSFDVTDRLGDITVPVLVAGGTHDRITLAEASRYLADHLPKAEIVLFEGCGHMTMLERHRELNETLESFFSDTLGPVRTTRRGRA